MMRVFSRDWQTKTLLQILWLILIKEELCVCDIMRVLGILQPMFQPGAIAALERLHAVSTGYKL